MGSAQDLLQGANRTRLQGCSHNLKWSSGMSGDPVDVVMSEQFVGFGVANVGMSDLRNGKRPELTSRGASGRPFGHGNI